MSIGRTFAIIIAAAIGLTIGLGAVSTYVLWSADAVVRRIQGANSQLEALHDLDGATGRYGRQVVDQLLFGYDRSGPLQTARNDMQRILTGLARATRDEFNVVMGPEDLQGQLPELEQVRRMTDLFYQIDQAANRAFTLATDGDSAAAMNVASREIDFRLTNELQPLIDSALSRERAELAGRTRDLDAVRGQAALAGGLLAALMLAVIIAAAAFGIRRFARQLAGRAGWVRSAISGDPPDRQPPTAGNFGPLDLALDDALGTLSAERERRAAAELQLRDLDTDRSQFLADVGHQLRTPLTVLRGEADVALRGATGEPALRESMERVRAQSVELALLLDDLIDAVRQETDALPMVMSRVALGDLVAAAAGEGRVLAEPREVEIAVDQAPGPIVVPGDFRRLKQALMIGIDNAVKHSPPGGTIRIETAEEAGKAWIRIADEGPGIAEEDLPHLFRRFYRGRHEKELLNSGFGIGLAIAKGIVEQHGGTIALGSRPEGGALFEIGLPLGPGAAR
jgi:signal transduction histidine kinase